MNCFVPIPCTATWTAFGSTAGRQPCLKSTLGNISFGGVDQGSRFHDGSTKDQTGTLVYAGDMDEIRVYKDALTTEEVASLAGVTPPDDDAPASLSVADRSLAEGDSGTNNMVFTVSLDKALDEPVTFTVNTVDTGDASAGLDFQAVANELITISAGQQLATVSVPVVGDLDEEADESFELHLSNVLVNGVDDPTKLVVADAIAVGTILDDDSDSGSGDVPEAITSFLFEEAAGTTAQDTAPAGTPDAGTLLNGATWYADGAHDSALWFDGVDDALLVSDSPDFNLDTISQRTIAFWFKADNVNETQKQVLFKQSGLTRGLNIYLDSGQLYVGGWSDKAGWSGTYLSTGQITSNHWHHVALVIDADEQLNADSLRGYLDWQLFGMGPAAAIKKHSGDVSFGAVVQGSRFHDGDTRDTLGNTLFAGALDDIHVFNEPLTTEQLSSLACV